MHLKNLFNYKIKEKELVKYVGRKNSIILPDWIEKIGRNAFLSTGIRKVDTNKVNSLAPYSFYNSRLLEEVILHDGITTIPECCFDAAFSLRNITLPSTISRIETKAFSRCGDLKSITLPDGLTHIANNAFEDSGLYTIRIPSSVKEIGTTVFKNSERLGKVSFECDLKVLPPYIFYQCEQLKNVRFTHELKEIGEFAFYCSDASEFNIPDTVKKISTSAFENSKITYADLSNVSEIGTFAFSGCGYLETVIFNDKLKVITSNAFSWSAIKELTIPSSVIHIEKEAFDNCVQLERIVFENENVDIHKEAFENCMNLKTIVYRGKEINVSNLILNHIDKDVLDYIYTNSEELSKLKAPVTIRTLNKLKEANLLEDFYNNSYFKAYNQIYRRYTSEQAYTTRDIDSLFMLCYTLGVFDKELFQKSSELIKDAIEHQKINQSNIESLSFTLEFKPINKNMIIETCENRGAFFKSLMKYSYEMPKLIGLSFANYDEVQRHNTSNNCEHRRLKPTAQKFYDYFNVDKFEGVETLEDEELAKEIGKFYKMQYIYDKAKKIVRMFKEKGVRRSLISEEKRVESLEEQLVSVKESINKGVIKLDKTLDRIYYEFLLKDDPRNLTSGTYCTHCCGHIEGVGEDIAIGSMLDNNTQTLVVNDNKGEIISKAVFYVNSDNEIIINGIYVNEDEVVGIEQLVSDKYIEALNIFIEDYKKNNGIEINKVYLSFKSPLIENFNCYDVKYDEDINVVNYSKYSIDKEKSYPGDTEKGIICIINKPENIIRNPSKR